ncbi:hypothetical protein CMUS01_10971 [Colletotrichum musicola]|uniref:Uncharacterized protein n=1 Tax=Colletotrichum musicola TaxID=2175873 RepID=A0A8H6N7N6_9PEZI|nr:hypothetical protein CMUS01_10971 [Colletotrichum musicola]
MGKLCCSLVVVFAKSQQLPPCIDLTWKDHLLEQDKQRKSLKDWTLAVAGVRNKAVNSEFEITFTHCSLAAKKKNVRASRAAYWELGLAAMELIRRVRAQGSPQQLGELLIDRVDRWNFRVADTARAANLWGTTVETVVWRSVQGKSYSGTVSKSLPAISAYAIEKSFPLAAKHMTRDTIKVDGSLDALSQLFSKGNPHFQRSWRALHDTSAFRGTATASEVAREVNREMANSMEWHAVLLETLQSLAGEGGVLEKFIREQEKEASDAWSALEKLSDSDNNQDEKLNDFSEKEEPFCKSSVEARDVSKSEALENEFQRASKRFSDWTGISHDYTELAAEVRQLHWAVSQQSVVTHWLELKEDIEKDAEKKLESGNSWLRNMLGIRNVQVMKPMSATHIEQFRKSQWRAQPLKREMATFRTHEKGLAKQEVDVWKHLKSIYRDIERLGCRVTVGAA